MTASIMRLPCNKMVKMVQNWLLKGIQVIICTNAFINKRNVFGLFFLFFVMHMSATIM